MFYKNKNFTVQTLQQRYVQRGLPFPSEITYNKYLFSRCTLSSFLLQSGRCHSSIGNGLSNKLLLDMTVG